MTKEQRSPRREYSLAVQALENAKHRLTAAQNNLKFARRRVYDALMACNEHAARSQKR